MDLNNIRLLLESFQIHAQSKIIEDPDDAKHRRFKDKWLLIITSGLLYLTFLLIASFIIFHPDNTNVGIGINALTGIVMGVSGYYIRGKNR